MSELLSWEVLRYLNWIILFAAWLIMLYRGVLNWVKFRMSFDWARFTNLAWTTLAVYSIGEVLYQHANGGPRVIGQTGVALLQLWVVIFKFGVDESLPYRELPKRNS